MPDGVQTFGIICTVVDLFTECAQRRGRYNMIHSASHSQTCGSNGLMATLTDS